MDLTALTDKELTETTRQAYERLMLLEVNGAQYSTPNGMTQVSNAKQRYRECRAEQRRRIPSVNHLTQEVA